MDVSAQEVAYWILTSWPEFWETEGVIPKRFGGPPRPPSEGARERRLIYPVKDGHVAFWVQGGRGATVDSTLAVLKWMEEDGKDVGRAVTQVSENDQDAEVLDSVVHSAIWGRMLRMQCLL
mgnify:CR=1 FL=1